MLCYEFYLYFAFNRIEGYFQTEISNIPKKKNFLIEQIQTYLIQIS